MKMLHLMKVYESYTTIAAHIKYYCGTVELQMDFKSVNSHGLSSSKSLTIHEIKGIYAIKLLLLFGIISGYRTPKFKSMTE